MIRVFLLFIIYLEPALAWSKATFEEKFIQSNITISEWFDSVAEGLDLFLVEKKLTNKKNETNVRLENSTTFVERENPVNSLGLRVNMRLPNVEEYWNLKFTTYDEKKENRGVRRALLRQTPKERNYGATVGLFRKLGNVRTAFEPRIGLQDPVKVSHSLSFESVAETDLYNINPKIEFFADPDKGTGIFTAFNLNFELSKVYSLTFLNEGEYEEKKHLFSVTNGFSLGQGLTPRSALSYGFYTVSNNQTSYHLEAYSLSIGWSELVYRNILDYQIVPNLSFTKDQGWRGVPGITLNLNFNF